MVVLAEFPAGRGVHLDARAPQGAQQVGLRVEVDGCRAELLAHLHRERLHARRLPPGRRTGAQLLLEHGLVHRAAPRQPGRLQLDPDERTRRLRREQQAQRVRVDAGVDERELARELGDDRVGSWGRARIGDPGREVIGIRRSACELVSARNRAGVGCDVGGSEVVEIEQRAVRHRRHGGLAGDRAAAVGRAGREPCRTRNDPVARAASVAVERSRIAPHRRRSWHRSTRTPAARRRGYHRRVSFQTQRGCSRTSSSRTTSASPSGSTTAMGVAGSSGSTRAMRPRSTAATTICTGPFSRPPTTVSAGRVTMDAWTSG